MRKISTLILFVLLGNVFSQAQIWLELGGKGMAGITGFTNQNISKDNNHDSQLGLAHSIGGVATLNLGENHGLQVEGLTATYHQSLTFRNTEGSNAINIEWKSFDWYFLYRYYRSNGAFLELGPKVTYIGQAQQSFRTDWANVTSKYENKYYSAVFGVGGFVAASQILTLKTGIRAEYALTDMVSAEGQVEGFPSPYTTFSSYAETRPFRLGFYIEVTLGVGGIAEAECGKRGVLFGTAYR